MENNNLLVVEKRLVARFLDMFIRFGLILALASFCYTVFSPFLNMMLWAVILAVTLYPLPSSSVFCDQAGRKTGLVLNPDSPARHCADRGPHGADD